jgi:hypothetical protein
MWVQAGIRTLGDLLDCSFPIPFQAGASAYMPRNLSFPSPLRDSAGFPPASHLSSSFEGNTCTAPNIT